MSRKTWSIVGLGIIFLAAAWFLLSGHRPRTPSDNYAKAAFTRPTILSNSANGFRVQIAKTDGIKDVPSVESGVSVSIEVTLPEDQDPEIGFVFVVPRLLSQGAEGFYWIYPSCDHMLGLSKDGRTVKGAARTLKQKVKFNLRPAEYVVRYYLQSSPFDAEKGPPMTEFLGEGRLVVTNSKSGAADTSLVPLEDESQKIPSFRPSNEETP